MTNADDVSKMTEMTTKMTTSKIVQADGDDDDTIQTYVCYECCRYTNQSDKEREMYDPLCKRCYDKQIDDEIVKPGEFRCDYCEKKGKMEESEEHNDNIYHRDCIAEIAEVEFVNEENEDVLDVFESLEKLENVGDVSKLKRWFYSIPTNDTAERDKALCVLYDIYSLKKNK